MKPFIIGKPGKIMLANINRALALDVGRHRIAITCGDIFLTLSERHNRQLQPKIWQIGPVSIGYWGKGTY